jgi:hypothetical protein
MEKERCPKCAEKGQDTKGDNLAIYPDGHAHCFGCGYHKGIPTYERVRQLSHGNPLPVKNVDETYDFPTDYTTDIALPALNWLKSFSITEEEIKRHRMGWSDERKLLIFPVLDGGGDLIMWQGRRFSPSKPMVERGEDGKLYPKYITKGPVSDILHLVGVSTDPKNTIILVEDLISAIKVGRTYQSAPLWGSNIPLKLIQRLSGRFNSLGVWLDRDKMDVALKAVLRASQYLPSYLITSVFDPKGYNTNGIQELVEEAIGDKIEENGMLSTKEAVSQACRRLSYVEAIKKYPSHIRNLTDYTTYRNSFDNVEKHEVIGPL